VLSVSGLLIYSQTKAILLKNTQTALVTINTAVTQQIGIMLQDKVTLVNRMAAEPRVIEFLKSVERRNEVKSNAAYPWLHTYLDQIQQTNSNISVTWIASEPGSYFVLNDDTISSPDYEIKTRPWHAMAMDSVGVFFTDPYIDIVTSKLAVDIMKKVVVDNKTVGFVAISMFIDNMPAIMNKFHVGQAGYTFLLDKKGTILYHPNRNLVMKAWNDQVPQWPISKEMPDEMALVDLNGRYQYTIFAHLPISDWYVASAIPESEVLDRLKLLNQVSLFFNIGSGIILVFLVTLVLNYMLKNIPYIIRQLHLIAEGQLPSANTLQSEDELGRISTAIHEMAHKIHSSMMVIHDSAYYDSLTGLPNRRFLNEKLDSALQEAKQNNEGMALFFIDLDNFKLLNDTRGHKIGDELLRQVGSRLKSTLPEGSTVFRFGGDEFVIIMERMLNELEVKRHAEKLHAAFSHSFDLFDFHYYVNFSAGIVMFPNDGASEEELLKNSDTAMYRAKSLGKNRIQFFSQDMIGSLLEKEKLTQALRHAVADRSLTLHYQALVDVRNSRLYGFETLLRWTHPEFGHISPSQFIPLAEQLGLIVPLGEWVLCEACKVCKSLQADHPISITVNVSVLQLRSPNFIDQVKMALQQSGLDPRLLVLEITEGILIESFEQAVDVLQQLRSLGVRLALDDFGTGYSSLSYLKNLPIHILKLDKMFIWDLEIDSLHSNKFVGPIIDLAHNLGMRIAAEGVETKDQAEMLSAWGCDILQGYWYSKPVPIEDLESVRNRFAVSKFLN
jgi:diguanylate cyclase (GGDEF)-like protein